LHPDPITPTLHNEKRTDLHPLIPNPTPNPTYLHPLDLDPTPPPGSRVATAMRCYWWNGPLFEIWLITRSRRKAEMLFVSNN